MEEAVIALIKQCYHGGLLRTHAIEDDMITFLEKAVLCVQGVAFSDNIKLI